MGSWRFKEPSTIEECDSTWGSDSEGEEPPAEDDSGISDSISPAESERASGQAGDTSPQVRRGRGSMRVRMRVRMLEDAASGGARCDGGIIQLMLLLSRTKVALQRGNRKLQCAEMLCGVYVPLEKPVFVHFMGFNLENIPLCSAQHIDLNSTF